MGFHITPISIQNNCNNLWFTKYTTSTIQLLYGQTFYGKSFMKMLKPIYILLLFRELSLYSYCSTHIK